MTKHTLRRVDPILSSPLLADRGEPARRALLMAGAQVFGEKGIAAATTREIAMKAGQNISAIKYYFQSKEGLYLEIARSIVGEMDTRLAPFSQGLAARDDTPSPREAMDRLKQMVAVMARTMLMSDFPALAQFIVREQQNPTPAFDVIYQGGMRGAHETVTTLLAIAFGLPRRSTDTVLRAHAVMGQVLGFKVAHAALLRRTGWTDVGPGHIDAVVEAIHAGLELMFAGRADPVARARRGPARGAPRAPSSSSKEPRR